MNWLILIALALVATGTFYVRWRWHRAPQAYRAMIALAAGFFVAGTLTGAWLVHRITSNPVPLPSASSVPAAANTAISRGFDPARAVLPDAKLTPGDIFPGVSADDVCTLGWAGEHRHVTEAMRAQVYREYGFGYDQCQGLQAGTPAQGCEVDHLIPLELGGSNDLKNLWPQPFAYLDRRLCAVYDPRPGAGEKDQLENELHSLVCGGKLSLAEAQHCIAANWVECWEKHSVPLWTASAGN